MSFVDAIKTCFRKYVTFSGRATRPEYWYFILFLFLGSMVASFLDAVLFGLAGIETGPGYAHARSNGPIAALFHLATILPALAAGWRRMHDTGRSGLYLLYPVIVMVGISTFAAFSGAFGAFLPGNGGTPPFEGLAAVIVMLTVIVLILSPFLVLWWLTRPSQPVSNQYGPNPNEVPQ